MKQDCQASSHAGPKFAGILAWIGVAGLAFHAAFAWAAASWFIILYLFALIQLARTNTWRKAFYSGLVVGILIAVVRLDFFWRIFSAGAIALWLICAFWIGLFVALARLALRPLDPRLGWLSIPFLWCGLEYFRSELYYFRFSWLSPAFAFSGIPAQTPLNHAGTYGLGFLLMTIASAGVYFWEKSRVYTLTTLLLGIGAIRLLGLVTATTSQTTAASGSVHVAGVQMEFPTEKELLDQLDGLILKKPDTELVVLSEYSFAEPIPEKVKEWCRHNQRYLIAGGKDPQPGNNFYNTAFVVSPAGEVVFRQVKAVPIQFFKDGLPAPEQRLWDSPWGKIGICICYDLSYTRVTDPLVRLGAQALIVPTMDVADWGENQHKMHSRVAPLRAAEYGIPIFRLASSGISQWVDPSGSEIATAPWNGDGAILSAVVEMRGAGRLPFDRWLAPVATGVTVLLILLFAVRRRYAGPREPSQEGTVKQEDQSSVVEKGKTL